MNLAMSYAEYLRKDLPFQFLVLGQFFTPFESVAFDRFIAQHRETERGGIRVRVVEPILVRKGVRSFRGVFRDSDGQKRRAVCGDPHVNGGWAKRGRNLSRLFVNA